MTIKQFTPILAGARVVDQMKKCWMVLAGTVSAENLVTQVYKVGQVLEPYVDASATGYRLPTDVQWEYAARGGVSSRRFPWGGDTIQHARANYNNSTSYGYDTSPTRGCHPDWDEVTPNRSPVGTFESGMNWYGLYDMARNVWEWFYELGAAGWGLLGQGGDDG